MRIKQMIFLISILIFISILGGCSQKTSVLFNENSCIPPCWRNIEFGQSKEESLNILNNMTDIDSGSLKWFSSNRPNIDESITWDFLERLEYGGSLSFFDEKLVMFSLRYEKGEPLQKFVDSFGEPQKILIHSSVGGGNSYSESYMIYTDQGICLVNIPNLDEATKEYKINPNTPIRYIVFSDKNADPSQLDRGCLWGFDKEIFQIHSQTWKGYTKYLVYQEK